MQNLMYFVTIILLIISVLSLYFLIKVKDRLKDLGTKLNLLEDQQTKDKQIIIETLNRQYTDVMLIVKSLQSEKEPKFDPSKYYEQAKDIVIKSGKASATLLQRRLKIGYAHAAGLLSYLEEKGIIGSAFGSEPREVLVENETEEQVSDDDLLVPEVIVFVSQLKTVSPTRIQRKFRIGYARSARLLDLLEEKGIVGPHNEAKPRKVLKK